MNMIKNLKRKSEAGYQMIDYYKDWKQVIYLTWLFPLFLHYYQPPTLCIHVRTLRLLTLLL